MRKEVATFAAGCFWGVEVVFSKIKGVLDTVVGYIGGYDKYKNPTYELVCSGKTGHAEAVQITYDSSKVSYEELLDVFWNNHDPTTPNRQGADVGTQYRSMIFYYNAKQRDLALKSKRNVEKKLGKKVATRIVKAKKFYPAEEYHQKYYEKKSKLRF